jgi:hypothetical protein
MDEMSMVRDLLEEPEPSAQIVKQGRQRLCSAAVRPVWWKRRFALWTGTALAVAGAAATVVMVALMLSGATTPPSASGGGPAATGAGASARGVLLAAAEQAASTPSDGSYWHVRTVAQTALPQIFGDGENRYSLEHTSVTEKWTSRAGRTWLGRRDWVQPKSAEDKAAWKRDGSPSEWCIGHTDTDPPEPICLHTAPGSASLTRVGQDTFRIAEGHDMTFEQLQQLPTDADTLLRNLTELAKHDLDPSASSAVITLNVESELANLLVDFPVSPNVRAAAFRALANMPDVTSIGTTKDELGRGGTGIEIRNPQVAVLVGDGSAVSAREGNVTRTLIIDTVTSQILADQTTISHDAAPTVERLILDSGWTNEQPHQPSEPGASARAQDGASV